MGLFARRPENPTAAWHKPSGRRLKVELYPPGISGVRLGQPFSRLSFLGPGVVAQTGMYEYPELGLVIEEEAGAFSWFTVVLRPDGFHDVAPYRGSLSFYGESFSPRVLKREQDWVQVFGDPLERDEDEFETILTWRWKGARIEVEFEPSDCLKTLRIGLMEG